MTAGLVAVDRVEVDDQGGRMVHLRTDEASAAACPACGVFLDLGAAAAHDPARTCPTARCRW
jgi:hypothetical protein